MKDFISKLAVTLLALPIFFALGGSPIAKADHYDWNTSGYCFKYNDAGRLLGQKEDSYCSGSNYYKWNSSGYCYKYNGAGRVLSQVEDSYCTGSNYYKWSSSGYCYKYNSAGRLLRQMDDSYCSAPSESSDKVEDGTCKSSSAD
ncbi:MAG: hypothetical protein ACXWQO_04855 [Bdellovibrionota bacterium]